MPRMPAISLIAPPGNRMATIELAKEIEKKGFSGIYTPSVGDTLALCEAISFATNEIKFGTSIMPIYFRTAYDIANTISFIHEISNGRFSFGIGVSHELILVDSGFTSKKKPLTDMRNFVAELKNISKSGSGSKLLPPTGELPPIILAGLRNKMVSMSEEIANGVVFANACLSQTPTSLSSLSNSSSKDEFFIGNMIPTCVNDDISTAKSVIRHALLFYVMLPNYRAYWRESGYVEEMEGIENALSHNKPEDIPHFITDRFLKDIALYGTATDIRDTLDSWFDAGIKTPILVPSSENGDRIHAINEIMGIY